MPDWTPAENILLGQNIDEVSTTKKHEFGQIVRCKNSTYGVGEFIYLKGVASTVVGSWVTYNSDDWTTALLVANAIGPVAIAMSVCDAATDYGWYQIQGKAQGLMAIVSDDAALYISSVAGQVDDSLVAGDTIWNAKAAEAVTAAATVADVEIARPWVNDWVPPT